MPADVAALVGPGGACRRAFARALWEHASDRTKLAFVRRFRARHADGAPKKPGKRGRDDAAGAATAGGDDDAAADADEA